MKIVSVEALPLTALFSDLYGGTLHVPPVISRPAAHFQSVPRLGQYSTIVRITVDTSLVGVGEAWGLPLPGAVAAIIDGLIAPFYVGRNASDPAALQHDVVAYLERLGHGSGFAMDALSGVDVALWDLCAKASGRSVAHALSSTPRRTVDCYVSPIMFQDTPEASADAARVFLDEGFTAVKIKAGRAIGTDIAHISAVRDVLGPDRRLLVDANGGYSLDQALEILPELQRLGVYWLEEPVPSDRLDELRQITRRDQVRIAYGENDFSLACFRNLIDMSGVHVVMPNVSRAGGLTGVVQIADLAQRRNVEFSLHGVGSRVTQLASVHALAATTSGGLFEINRFPNPLREDLTDTDLETRAGVIDIPSGLGLGCALRDEALRRFAAH